MVDVERDARASGWVTRAWVSVALIPVVLVAVSAMALAFFRYATHGSAPDYVPLWEGGIPMWVRAVEGVVCVAVVWLPCAAAARFGRRAVGGGDPRGRTPALVGVVVGAGYAVLTLGALVTL